jgi:MEMO1 family protein
VFKTRKSAFDGSFYPSKKKELEEFVKRSIEHITIEENLSKSVSYVAPHAGYIYSGETAAFTYKAMLSSKFVESATTIVIIGPNHTGVGRPLSVSMDNWETPLGVVTNDKELSKEIVQKSEYIDINDEAHENEHSIEVQLPFIQSTFPDKKASFICMGDQSIEASELLANAIIKASEDLDRKIVVLASSDFNHYESAETAKKKDTKLFGAVNDLNYKEFNKLVEEVQDTACGYGPITVSMIFAKHMGAQKGLVLKYNNSGDKTRDYSSVVAYSSIAFVKN